MERASWITERKWRLLHDVSRVVADPVVRQGLARAHVGAVVAFCATADALLIALGVAGVGTAIAASPRLATAVTAGGAAFLAAYGLRALRRAASPDALHAAPGEATPSP